jgi:DNA-binding response OmpR family regulator
MHHILVIDDEAPVRRLLRKLLERAGYRVTVAEDGDAGIKIQCKDPADLVITDLIMPKKEGIETVMDLRRDFPNTKIIVISGGGATGPQSYLKLAKTIGADRTLPKPLDIRTTLHIVRELLE